jgi:hypothetical protein
MSFGYNFAIFYVVQAVVFFIWAGIYHYVLRLPIDDKFEITGSLVLILLLSLFCSFISVLSLHLFAKALKLKLSRAMILSSSVTTTICIVLVNVLLSIENTFVANLVVILLMPIGIGMIYSESVRFFRGNPR